MQLGKDQAAFEFGTYLAQAVDSVRDSSFGFVGINLPGSYTACFTWPGAGGEGAITHGSLVGGLGKGGTAIDGDGVGVCFYTA